MSADPTLSFNNTSLRPIIAFNRVGADDFREHINRVVHVSGFYRDNLSVKPDYDRHTCWLSTDKQAGFAVSPELELINVFSMVKRHGEKVMEFATQQYPELHLNCFGGFLENYYAGYGFETFKRLPNWTADAPDVVFMRRNAILTAL